MRVLLAGERENFTINFMESSALPRFGCSVTRTYDVVDALSKVENGYFDLVISDLYMPAFEGGQDDKDAGMKVARAFSGPVIVVTGAALRPSSQESRIRVLWSAHMARELPALIDWARSERDQSLALRAPSPIVIRSITDLNRELRAPFGCTPYEPDDSRELKRLVDVAGARAQGMAR